MKISGAATQIQNQGVLLRVVEDYDITAATTVAALKNFFYGVGGLDRSNAVFGTIFAGTSGTVALVNVAGRWVPQITSVLGTVSGRTSSDFRLPVFSLFQDANAIPLSVLGEDPREYTFEIPIRITTPGVEVQIGIAPNGVAGVGFGGSNTVGIVWSSDPAVNGGALRVRRRMVRAGAITNEADTGVLLNAWQRLGVRYTEGATPKIEMLINGVPRFTLSGDAQMPTVDVPGGVSELGPVVLTSSAAAGTIVQTGPAIYQIRQLVA